MGASLKIAENSSRVREDISETENIRRGYGVAVWDTASVFAG